MTAMLPFGAGAVMSTRHEPADGLDFFPTPPWATRALCEIVLGPELLARAPIAVDPACGEGHMVETLGEYFPVVAGADIHDYGCGYPVQDYLASSPAIAPGGWTVMNPPFNLSRQFVRHALAMEDQGCAALVRLNWLECEERYELFSELRPTSFNVFVERVPMVKGRYDPRASTATAYGWAVWEPGSRRRNADTALRWIPPCKARLFRPADVRRWCAPAPLPLFDGPTEGGHDGASP